ncbi:MAG: NupC/NupG family nucleoside CNT transporter [Planctomycetota bacterium]
MTERLASLAGIGMLLGIGYLMSSARKRIRWHIVGVGILLQVYLALFLVRTEWVPWILTAAASACFGILALDIFKPLGGSWAAASRGLGLLGAFTVLVVALVYLNPQTSALALVGVLALVLWVRRRGMAPGMAHALRTAFALGGCGAVVLLLWTDVLPHDFVFRALAGMGKGVQWLAGATHAGTDFVIGRGLRAAGGPFIFVVDAVAIILLFSALMAVLYYVGFLPWLVGLMARVLRHSLGVSGAESLAAASNVFMGQTEAPFVVKPYLSRMTESEIMALMAVGFATIAGSVLGVYVGIFEAAQFSRGAADLIAASVMSAPAAFVFAKLIVPETETPETLGGAQVTREETGSNLLDALTGGVTAGMRLAVNVVAMLVVFIALIHVLDAAVGWFAHAVLGQEDWTFRGMYAYLFAPFAFFMGVPWSDCLPVGELIGTKTIFNEFIAYERLGTMISGGPGDLALGTEAAPQLQTRSVVLSTYALCGFANLGSIGIQIGGLSALAPERRPAFARLAFRAMVAGTLACQLTACIVGVLGRF